MAQHDMNIADQNGPSFLLDLNGVIAALVSNNSDATTPTVTVPYMWWADTTAGILKRRNAANTAWHHVMGLTQIFGNVDNTSDVNKPVSTAMQSALDGKEAADGSILKAANIGNTVQAYASNASQAEMEAGTEAAIRNMSPEGVKQAIEALASTSTAVGSVGSVIKALYTANGTSSLNTTLYVSAGTLIAGADLVHDAGTGGQTSRAGLDAMQHTRLNSTIYNGGGTPLSGTWRVMQKSAWFGNYNLGSGNWDAVWGQILLMRES